MARKIGVIGSGIVGQTLANGFVKHGYEFAIGTNTAAKRAALQSQTPGARVSIPGFRSNSWTHAFKLLRRN